MEEDKCPLHLQTAGESTHTKTGYRWVILGIFALFSFLQSAIWDTWGPISSSATAAIGFTSHDYDLLANWAPIGILPTMPFFIMLTNTKGPRLPVLLGGILVAVGTGLRCLPLSGSTLKFFIHAGQFLNAVAGCPVLGAAPLISNVWFPPTERVTATSCMLLLGNLGNAFSYLVGPAIVDTPNNCTANMTVVTTAHSITSPQFGVNFSTVTPAVLMTTACSDNTVEMRKQINILLYFEFALAVIIVFLILFFFKNKPENAPSASAAAERLKILHGMKALSKNVAFWIIVLSYSLVMGSYYGWYGIITILLTPHGISEEESGLAAFIMTLVGTAAGIAAGWFVDRMKGRMKWIMFASICAMFVTFLYLTIIIMDWISVSPFKFTKAGFWISFIVFGCLSNIIQPLGFEMAADVGYPVNEGTSTSVTAWFIMLSMFIFLTILNSVEDQQIANYLVLSFTGLAAPILAVSTKNRNVRMAIDTDGTLSDDEFPEA